MNRGGTTHVVTGLGEFWVRAGRILGELLGINSKCTTTHVVTGLGEFWVRAGRILGELLGINSKCTTCVVLFLIDCPRRTLGEK